MTPDDRAALDRQQRIARTPEIEIEKREPLTGQCDLFGGRTGWNLITSHLLDAAGLKAADELCRVELRLGKPEKSKGQTKPRKRKGG